VLAGQGLTVLVSTHYMDEAERCDRIVYLAYGTILARGTVDEVIGGSKLFTWIVTGDEVRGLSQELHDKPGIEQVSVFGVTLHISGTNEAALEKAIAPYRNRTGFTWTKARPSLEDVFIHLMAPFREQVT
jgi:ABC-2 type transport system ATP-binding protein